MSDFRGRGTRTRTRMIGSRPQCASEISEVGALPLHEPTLSGSSRRKEAHSIPTRSSEKRSEPRDLGCYVRLVGSWPQFACISRWKLPSGTRNSWASHPTPALSPPRRVGEGLHLQA